jgi:hypothetical protein
MLNSKYPTYVTKFLSKLQGHPELAHREINIFVEIPSPIWRQKSLLAWNYPFQIKLIEIDSA